MTLIGFSRSKLIDFYIYYHRSKALFFKTYCDLDKKDEDFLYALQVVQCGKISVFYESGRVSKYWSFLPVFQLLFRLKNMSKIMNKKGIKLWLRTI